MAREFVRNIKNTNVTGKNKEPLYTNKQNDLLNDENHVYVRHKNEYLRITGSKDEGQAPDISFRLDDEGNLYYIIK